MRMVAAVFAITLSAVAAIGSLVFLIAAGIFISAGCYEMLAGRNAPGWLGGRFFYQRGWASEPQWSKARWRQNGFFVVGFGFSFIIVSLALFLVAVGRLP